MSNFFEILTVGGLGAPAPSLVTPTFDLYVSLRILLIVPGLSVSGIPRLRFNNDTGTTAYAYNVSDNFAAPVGAFAGTANGIALGAVNATTAFSADLVVGNGPSQQHVVMFNGYAGVMDASAVPHILSGAAAWANTSQQITSVQLDAGPNGGNLNAGTGIMVLGANP